MIKWYSSYESISFKIKVTKSVENNLRPKLRKSVKGIHSDFALETTQQTKILNAIFRFIEICSDGKRFNMPKYVEIQLYG